MATREEEFFRRLAADAGLAFVRLEPEADGPDPVDHAAARLVPPELARRFRVVGVSATDGVLTLASPHPHERTVPRTIEALTGKTVEIVVSTPAAIDRALARVFGDRRAERRGRYSPEPPAPVVSLGHLEAALDPAAAQLLPERLCRRLGVLPLQASRGVLLVAASHPLSADELRLLEAATAHRPETVEASEAHVIAGLERVYSAVARTQPLGPPEGMPRAHAPGQRLGELLVATGALDRRTLRRALARQRRTGDQLGRILVAMRAVTDARVAHTLARQLRLPHVEGDLHPSPETGKLLPESLCRTHLIVPLEVVDDALVVAMADPTDPDAARALRFASALPTRVVVASGDAIRAALTRLHAEHYVHVSTTELIRRRPEESAYRVLSRGQKLVALALLAAAAVGFALAPIATGIALVILSIAFSFAASIFRFALVYRTIGAEPEIQVSDAETAFVDERSLPRYTVLVPLYHEAVVTTQLLHALERIDYPPTKLEVLLLLEEDDEETLAAMRSARLPPHFHPLIVPHSQPRTKPKACNYGLVHARGEYVVIYDAEDIPDPLQLKRAVVAFRRSPPDVVCIQAKLNYWNRTQNLLTRWFAAEYAQWFDLFLPGLDEIGGPVPLGGTSNHMPVQFLLELGAWDPFNVTEDADVGIRLARRGYRTAVLDSTTYEEANSRLFNWIRQRSRWVKGYLQTWLVHMRHPVLLWKELGPARFAAFQLTVGGTPLLFLLNPVFWALTSVYAATEAGWIRELFPGPIYYLGAFNLLLGNFLFTFMNVAGTLRRGYHDLVRAALFSPLYWALMSVGAWKGLLQLVTRPSYWEKTVHGLARIASERRPVA